MPATRLNNTLRRLFRAPVHLYRWKCGRLLGHRFLLLVHVGRRTGLRRHAVLEIMEYRTEGPEAVVMSAFGRNADWLRNIEAAPGPQVVIGSQHFVASHHLLDEEEAVRVITSYERRNWFIAPIIHAILSRLLGWRYDGSESARRRLVAQLPLIAFRPADRPLQPDPSCEEARST
jgi:deazaflavin-dependent oxidoreductase (nitroreductase family)